MLSALSTPKSKSPLSGRGPPSRGNTAAGEARVASLNQALDILNELFPNVDVGEFRHMLTTFSEESRLHVITETLLKRSKDGRVRAWRPVEPWEKFRSETYTTAAESLLYKEFKGLAHSTIKAVMAENNFDYARSRITLMEIAAKSWRFSFTNFFRAGRSVILPEPVTATSGCKELDEELFALGKTTRDKQISDDLKIAKLLNEAEHAAASELVECECCYGDYPWTEITVCSEGHFFCHNCLSRSVQEGLYGQGRNLLGEVCSARCLSSSALPPCEAFVPQELLSIVLPPDLFQSLEDKMATECLERSGLDLIRCPFCAYAEVVVPQDYRVKRSAKVLMTLALTAIGFVIPLALAAFIFLVVSLTFTLGQPIIPNRISSPMSSFLACVSIGTRIEKAVNRIQRRRRGSLFGCGNSRCRRSSCMECGKEWAPFHKCYEREEDSVRIYVEKAMADAIKRTCPDCHVSFVKSDGCNKLTCPCGYVMCYVCRADIGAEGYKHFCQHFRQVPGTTCEECDHCDLYLQEDEAAAIARAAEKAEADYFRKHQKPEGWKYKKRDHAALKKAAADMTWSEALDADLEQILEKILA